MDLLAILVEKLENIERQLASRKKILSVDDLVFMTGWSKSYIYKLTSAGKIPHYKPQGKTIFFERKDIEDYILAERISSEAEIDSMVDHFAQNLKVKRW